MQTPSIATPLRAQIYMSAHGRNILTQTEFTIPIKNGNLNLGTWQGIYLWEHRNSQFQRKIILTIMG